MILGRRSALLKPVGLEKIDNLAVDGLNGVNNSLAYKVHEIEKHFHNVEYWVGDGGGGVADVDGERFSADFRDVDGLCAGGDQQEGERAAQGGDRLLHGAWL